MRFPNHLKYTQDHEWTQSDGSTVTVGITDHAQSSLGDIVYVELPAVGRTLKKGETFGVVESIKAVSDLYAPFSGVVTAVNSELQADPAQINRDPHAGAWMIKMTALPSESPGELMTSEAYSKYVEELK